MNTQHTVVLAIIPEGESPSPGTSLKGRTKTRKKTTFTPWEVFINRTASKDGYSPSRYETDSSANGRKTRKLTSNQQATSKDFMNKFDALSNHEQSKVFENLLFQIKDIKTKGSSEILKDAMNFDIIEKCMGAGLNHVVEQILSYLDADSLMAVEVASVQYKQIISHEMLWKKIIEKKVIDDGRWKQICIKRGWMKHLFKPKCDLPHPDGWFYRKLYRNIKVLNQNIERSWRDTGRYSNSKYRIFPCESNMYDGANCVQFDDEIIVCGLNDGTAKVYSTETFRYIRTLDGHGAPVLCLQFDSTVIMTGSKDATVVVWNRKSGEVVTTLLHHTEAIFGLRFDDKWLVTCSEDKTLVVSERVSLTEILPSRTLVGKFGYSLTCVDFSKKYLVSGSEDSTIYVWKMESWLPHRNLHSHVEQVECVQIRNRFVVSGSVDMTIRVWDVEYALCLRILEDHVSEVGTLRFNDKYIVSGSDGLIIVYDFPAVLNPDCPENSLCLQHIENQHGAINGLDFDNFKIVSGSLFDTIMVYEFIDLNSPAEDIHH